MKTCPHCDRQIKDDSFRVCPYCKNPLALEALDSFSLDDFSLEDNPTTSSAKGTSTGDASADESVSLDWAALAIPLNEVEESPVRASNLDTDEDAADLDALFAQVEKTEIPANPGFAERTNIQGLDLAPEAYDSLAEPIENTNLSSFLDFENPQPNDLQPSLDALDHPTSDELASVTRIQSGSKDTNPTNQLEQTTIDVTIGDSSSPMQSDKTILPFDLPVFADKPSEQEAMAWDMDFNDMLPSAPDLSQTTDGLPIEAFGAAQHTTVQAPLGKGLQNDDFALDLDGPLPDGGSPEVGSRKTEIAFVQEVDVPLHDDSAATGFLDINELADGSIFQEGVVNPPASPSNTSSKGFSQHQPPTEEELLSGHQEISLENLFEIDEPAAEQPPPPPPSAPATAKKSSPIELELGEEARHSAERPAPQHVPKFEEADESDELDLDVPEEVQARKQSKKKAKDQDEAIEDKAFDTSAYVTEDPTRHFKLPLVGITLSLQQLLIGSLLLILLIAANGTLFVFFKLRSNDGFMGKVYTGGKIRLLSELREERMTSEFDAVVDTTQKNLTTWSYSELDRRVKKFSTMLKDLPKHRKLNTLQKELEFLMCVIAPSENQGRKQGLVTFSEQAAGTLGISQVTRKKFEAYVHFLDGRFGEARDRLKEYFQEVHNDFTARYYLGIAFLKNKEAEEALNVFSALRAEFPSRYQSFLGLALANETKGMFDKAQNYYYKAYELGRGDIQTVLHLGRFFEGRKDLDKALNYFSIATEGYLEHSSKVELGIAYSGKAELLVRLNRIDDAVKELKKAVNICTSNPAYPYRLGQILSDAFKPKDAVEYFKTAYDIDPQSLPHAKALIKAYIEGSEYVESDKLLKILMPLNPEDPDLWYFRGLNFLELDELDKARQDLEKALSLDPRHSLSELALANYYDDLGETEKAVQFYTSALGHSPEDYRIHYYYGRFLFQTQRDAVGGRQHLEQAIKLRSTFSPAYNLLGEIFYSLKDYEKAFPNFKAAVEYNPGNTRAMVNVAMIHKKEHNYDKAAKQLDAVLTLDPENSQAKALYAEVLLITEKDEERFPHYHTLIDEAIVLDPENDYAYFLKGYLFELKKNYREAINQYNIAIKLQPADVNYRSRLAQIYLLLGHFDKALSEVNEVLKITPNNARVLDIKGKIYLQNNQLKAAAAIYENVIKLDPFDYEAYLALGNILKTMGQDSATFKHLKKGITLFRRKYGSFNDLSQDVRQPVCKASLQVGNILHSMRPKDALTWYAQAIEICPEWPTPHKHLGYYWKRNQNYARALMHFERYLESQPADSTQIRDEIFFLKRGH
ncbi:MAG: hypothetical protein A2284_18775 [Deltaproteobacteria bacterium RIFOXYA12_FULL_61_11]|nr:MAG: hypothetical protein A2284_18775 [Deltaproteobacteria bacterium RIFOXYA12_FULL_61_11]